MFTDAGQKSFKVMNYNTTTEASTVALTITSDDKVGIGTGTSTPKAPLQVKGGDSLPEPGEPGPFCVGQTTTYGVTIGNGTNGKGYIQAGRFDGSSVTYGLNLNPHGGGIGIGNGDETTISLLTLKKTNNANGISFISGKSQQDSKNFIKSFDRYIEGTTGEYPGQLTNYISFDRRVSAGIFDIVFGCASTYDGDNVDATPKMTFYGEGNLEVVNNFECLGKTISMKKIGSGSNERSHIAVTVPPGGLPTNGAFYIKEDTTTKVKLTAGGDGNFTGTVSAANYAIQNLPELP